MPSAINLAPNGITKFTNCRLVRGDALVWEDLWVSSTTGKIMHSQASFYDHLIVPDHVVDLGGRIVSPGLIECQLNGAFGFSFSTLLKDMSLYGNMVRDMSRVLVRTGVTSFVPTITSQLPELYQKALPYLGPSGHLREPEDGAESLGAHVEGPFLNPSKNGIHNVDVFREANSFKDLEDCYGAENLTPRDGGTPIPIRMITVAPELASMTALIPKLTARGVAVSMGHSEASYEEASAAVEAGATMITHLFNAMRPLHHRNPGIFGVLGIAESRSRPFFGVIADGVHLHPTTVKIAYSAHPEGFILVTDAMHMAGLPDGSYKWTNGDNICNVVKVGSRVILEGSDTLAGTSITLIDCVNNFMKWSGCGIPKALKAVTATPAAMLSLHGVKGTLDAGSDADLVVFSENLSDGDPRLRIDEVWKFGKRIWGTRGNGNA